MKILMTADTVGGVWTYAVELARALRPHAVQITLATMGARASDEQRAEISRLTNVELFESDYKLEWMIDPWTDVAAAGDWLLALDARFRPDVIHLNGYAHAALGWSAPVIVVAHSCVLSWWRAVKDEDAPPEWNIYREVVTGGLRHASLVAAPTAAMLDALRLHYDFTTPARAIHNGRDAGEFPARAAKDKEPYILSVGRLWDAAKNTQALDRVAPNLPWSIHIAGDAAHPADGAGATHANARFLGRLTQTELADAYAHAAIYASPALYEPFGLSALEAAHAGCALVLGDIQTLREVWQDAALYVAPHDTEELTARLIELISDADLRAEMARRATARATHFTPARMADEYLRAYTELTTRTPRSVTAGTAAHD